MDSPDKKSVDEKRVKPTVIRRRAKETPPEPAAPQTPAAKAAAPAAKQPERVTAPRVGLRPVGHIQLPQTPSSQPKTGAAQPSGPGAFPPAPEKEDKFKKVVAPKKKKSKAELELEDIQRAGGLKQFAQKTLEEVVAGEPEETWEPAIERVFEPSLAVGRRKKHPRREFKKTTVTETNVTKKVIRMENAVTVSELSQKMGIKSSEIIRKLMNLGVMVTANQGLDVDTATLIATDYGYEIQHTAFKEEEVLEEAPTEEKTELR
ncbi:MAG: translation initiation factor IF-2 N-terminal domain-containing protein, partial [bacterium]|nr:translation initiation factor IF-2 N-terminal domain-containing protein [bacterium]